jgi:hypothetical protein
MLFPETMKTSRLIPTVLAGAVCIFASMSSGCYAEAVPAPAYADGYAPQYYDGYVVYYDGVGRPYYHMNGVVYWVPPSSPFYVGLTGHWRSHRAEYGHWYGHYGYRYRGYRRYH